VALQSDCEVKTGQIDHIDGDPSNNDLDNLIFLCLEHHNQKGSRTSQSKNFTTLELKRYRNSLYKRYPDVSVPADLVGQTWSAVKAAFKAVGDRHKVKISYVSFGKAADELQAAKLITIELAERIRQLRNVRNTACFEFNPDWRAEAEEEFIREANEIIQLLDSI